MGVLFKSLLVVCALAILFFSCAGGSVSSLSQRIDELKDRDKALLTESEKRELQIAEEFVHAERYISLGQFSGALEIVQSIIGEYSDTIYSDKAYFLKGLLYANMLNFDRDPDKAAAAYRMVIATGPESEFDEKAKEALGRLRK